MKQDSLLLIVAVCAVAIAIVGVGVTYNSIGAFSNFLTGYAVENGTVNVTVLTTASINISSANGTAGKMLDWGNGSFDSGANYVLLISNDTVINGTWANISEGFIVENVGNVNVTVGIHATYNASETGFLGTSTDPSVPEALFQYNITDSEDGSCNFTTGFNNTWKNFTDDSVTFCEDFDSVTATNSIQIDILLGIPSLAETGELVNDVILTYEQAEA